MLALDPARAHLASEKVLSELKNLAQWLALKPEVRASSERVPEADEARA